MKKAISFNIFLLTLATIITFPIYAHPGRTAIDGCHYCRTNCDKWGVPWNERHCHGGGSVQGVQESQPIYTPPTNTPIPFLTWTPVPTKTPTPSITPTLTPTLTPTVTSKSKPSIKKVDYTSKTKQSKKSFWQWLFNR